jgi:hypothetical protein
VAQPHPRAISAHMEGFPAVYAAPVGATAELEELQGFSRSLLAKLETSRSAGQFSQSEIELLRKKLSVVVNAYGAERARTEGELTTVRRGWHTTTRIARTGGRSRVRGRTDTHHIIHHRFRASSCFQIEKCTFR